MVRHSAEAQKILLTFWEFFMQTFKCMVRLPNGTTRMIEVQAQNPIDAKEMLKGMYGADKVIGTPMRA